MVQQVQSAWWKPWSTLRMLRLRRCFQVGFYLKALIVWDLLLLSWTKSDILQEKARIFKIEKLIAEEEDDEDHKPTKCNSMEKSEREKRQSHGLRISTNKNGKRMMIDNEPKALTSDVTQRQKLILEKRTNLPRKSKHENSQLVRVCNNKFLGVGGW